MENNEENLDDIKKFLNEYIKSFYANMNTTNSDEDVKEIKLSNGNIMKITSIETETGPKLLYTIIPEGSNETSPTHSKQDSSMNLDTKKKTLQTKMAQAVEDERYEIAAKCRDEITRLESITERVKELYKDKELVVKELNFERAMELTDEIEELVNPTPPIKKPKKS